MHKYKKQSIFNLIVQYSSFVIQGLISSEQVRVAQEGEKVGNGKLKEHQQPDGSVLPVSLPDIDGKLVCL